MEIPQKSFLRIVTSQSAIFTIQWKLKNALFTNVHETSKIGHSDIWSHFKFNDGMIQRGFDAKWKMNSEYQSFSG